MNEDRIINDKAKKERPRNQSLFSENAIDNHPNGNFFENTEKNVKINLLIENKKNHLKQEDRLNSLNLRIDSNITIFDLIKNAVDSFNDKFRNENFKYLLSNNCDNYKLKVSKKNGSPNKDIPGKYLFLF